MKKYFWCGDLLGIAVRKYAIDKGRMSVVKYSMYTNAKEKEVPAMPNTYRKHPNTRVMIIQEAARMFTEDGYSKSSINQLSKNLKLSPGNVTFYFRTKEHLLETLVDDMSAFQHIMMEQETKEGRSSLLAYCLELTAIASVCEESEIARDFFASAYASGLTLARIRANDVGKTREVFGPFCPDWDDVQWVATENIVSGIEFATIMTREENTPLALQIRKTLDAILYIYNVPADLRELKIGKVLSMDYRALGHRMLIEFPEYVKKRNEEKMAQPPKRRGKKPAQK